MDRSDCTIVETNLKGTRVQADSILENYEAGSPVEEISENFGIPQTMIREPLNFAAHQQNHLRR
jgi:uncharacterized protein (DUF433 family)